MQDRKDKFIAMFGKKARLAQTFGLKLSFDEQNRAIVTMPYDSQFDNAMGGIHGGVIATLMDNAGWFTCAVARQGNGWVATSEMSFHLLRPVKQEALYARGELIKSGKRQDIIEMRCFDSHNNLVAHGTGTFIYLDNINVSFMEDL